MTISIGGILMYGGGGPPVTRFETILVLLIAGTIILVAVCRGIVEEWIERTHGRNWPTVSAVIDGVSVTLVEDNRISSLAIHYWPSYLATLTYFYNNPERQTGDYKRSFGKKEDAEAWADSYKGETVKVHVDPRDPTRSVLREEDL
ncbi:MAG: DUF3592 domain-containing protein [Terracidiphilus sp.]